MHARLVAVDVVLRPQLPSVVVAPGPHLGIAIDHVDESAAHVQLLNLLLERCFKPGLFDAILEEGRVFLDSSDDSWELLVVLNESVGGPSAERPAPEEYIAVAPLNNVLAVIHDQVGNRYLLKVWHRRVIVDVLKLVLDTALALEVQASGQDRP